MSFLLGEKDDQKTRTNRGVQTGYYNINFKPIEKNIYQFPNLLFCNGGENLGTVYMEWKLPGTPREPGYISQG